MRVYDVCIHMYACECRPACGKDHVGRQLRCWFSPSLIGWRDGVQVVELAWHTPLPDESAHRLCIEGLNDVAHEQNFSFSQIARENKMGYGVSHCFNAPVCFYGEYTSNGSPC